MTIWRALPLCLLLAAFPAYSADHTLLDKAYEHWKQYRYKEATDIFRPLAAEGDPVAQYYMGEAARQGLGIEYNPENALEWHKMAAEQGFPPAENKLAVWLLEDDVQNIIIPRLLIRAAQKGFAPAQYNLCRLYATGEQPTLARDRERAISWCRKAAQQGHQDARQALIMALEHGIGTEQDKEQAQWWRQQSDKDTTQ